MSVATIIEARGAGLRRYPVDHLQPMWAQIRPEHVPDWEDEDVFLIQFGDMNVGARRQRKHWRIYRMDANGPVEPVLVLGRFEEVQSVLRALERATDPECAYGSVFAFSNDLLVRKRNHRLSGSESVH